MDRYDTPARQPHRPGQNSADHRRWLGIFFKCCSVYGRIYRNAHGTAYQGGCPRCGAAVRAQVGTHGTSQRFFEAE